MTKEYKACWMSLSEPFKGCVSSTVLGPWSPTPATGDLKATALPAVLALWQHPSYLAPCSRCTSTTQGQPPGHPAHSVTARWDRNLSLWWPPSNPSTQFGQILLGSSNTFMAEIAVTQNQDLQYHLQCHLQQHLL